MGVRNYLKRVVKTVLNKPVCVYQAEKNYIIKDTNDELVGKVAVITGANGTLGRSISHFLHASGALVYLCGRDINKLNKLASEFQSNVKTICFEITNEEDVSNAFKQIFDAEGRIDILVNCAGGSARKDMKPLVEQDMKVVDMVISSNLRGTLLCSKYSLKYMIKNKSGVIINIASTTGVQGNSGNCDYTSAKSGIIGLTKALAQEVGIYNIRVNCVSPGFIQTGEFDEKRVEYLERTNFLHTVGEPEDIANSVLFLCTEKSKFITGINLVVDGGRILGLHTFNS